MSLIHIYLIIIFVSHAIQVQGQPVCQAPSLKEGRYYVQLDCRHVVVCINNVV